LWAAYWQERTVLTLDGTLRLRLQVRRCRRRGCGLFGHPYRPEEEGSYALPHGDIGLDVIAFVGAQRFGEHRSVPEIRRALQHQQLGLCERSVTNLVQRYEELVSLELTDRPRLQARLRAQGRAIDGLQPDVGHEVLWVIRECLSGEVLLARPLLSAAEAELSGLLREVRRLVPVPIAGIVSDGQQSLRRAVASALPGVPHQVCQFHYLREAGHFIFEADRHAKKEQGQARSDAGHWQLPTPVLFALLQTSLGKVQGESTSWIKGHQASHTGPIHRLSWRLLS
jgi:hypothetical protein